MAVHHETIGHSGIDSLHGTSLAVQALPLPTRRPQRRALAKIVDIHFGAHHPGPGAGCDPAQTIALGPALTVKLEGRHRTHPLQGASLLLMTLIMHQPNTADFRTAAIKITALGTQHRVVHIRMQRPRRRLELVRIKMVLLLQIARVNQRQNVPVMQFPTNPVVVRTTVGHKGFAPTAQVRINQPVQQRLSVRVLIVAGRYHIEVNRQLPVDIP